MKINASSAVALTRHIELSDKSTQKDGRDAIVRRNWFINPDEHEGLAAYRIEIPEAGSIAAPHFHTQDQFQVFVDCPGAWLGADALQPVMVQYADACSPYGPIVGGPQGVAFFVFRLMKDQGAFVMPESRGSMTKKPGRIVLAHLPDAAEPVPAGGVQALEAPHADGLAIFRLAAGPGGRVVAPSPASGGGQYVLIASGAARSGDEVLPARSCLFVSPDEAALEITAGSEGFNAVLLQFPKQSWAARLAAAH
ncbi:MAG: hypothetical protein FJY55_01520 [Betaproteobacteria bacterium]|nr:hypothetical protein [Betaproteobacteria bacterium]